MGIVTYENNIETQEITKSYTDFSNASTSKSIDLTTLAAKSGILSLEIVIDDVMKGLPNCECLVTLSGGGVSFLKNINTSSFKQNPNKAEINLLVDPFINSSQTIISALMSCEGVGAWSVAKLQNVEKYTHAGCGTQTAGLSFGGHNGITAALTTITEEYNGVIWALGGNLSTARCSLAGCGVQDAGLSFGGSTGTYSAVTEEYNGTSWSGGGALATARYTYAGCGTQTAGLSIGGWTGTFSGVTEEYNGTIWTSGGALLTTRDDSTGFGLQTTAIAAGGQTTGALLATTEAYDGATWTSNISLNSVRYQLSSCGLQTAGLIFGGTKNISNSEQYNGTSWFLVDDLNGLRLFGAGCGTQSAALSFGGYTGLIVGTTEEYNKTTNLNLNGLTSGNLTFKIKYIKYYN